MGLINLQFLISNLQSELLIYLRKKVNQQLAENVALSWRFRAKRLSKTIINLVFPPVCVACKQVGSYLCDACYGRIQWLQEPLCSTCGRVVSRPTSRCYSCRLRPLPLTQIRAAVLFAEPIPKIIHNMKYNGLFSLAEPLADLMVKAWPQWEIPVDLVIPIPLHPDRERKRGYNQSTLLAKRMCEQLGLPVELNVLKRIRHTVPQVGLSAAERLTNVQQAFAVDAHLVTGRKILLIDDVCTTGATMAAAATELQLAGADIVAGYCVARAL